MAAARSPGAWGAGPSPTRVDSTNNVAMPAGRKCDRIKRVRELRGAKCTRYPTFTHQCSSLKCSFEGRPNGPHSGEVVWHGHAFLLDAQGVGCDLARLRLNWSGGSLSPCRTSPFIRAGQSLDVACDLKGDQLPLGRSTSGSMVSLALSTPHDPEAGLRQNSWQGFPPGDRADQPLS